MYCVENVNVSTSVVQQVSALGETLPNAVWRTMQQYSKHLASRKSIRIDRYELERKIHRYSKKKSLHSKSLTCQLLGFAKSLDINVTGAYHRPTVIPFGTVTGRNTTSGSTLNQISKVHWSHLLSPPKGTRYVLLDYQQQEPVIAAFKAGNKRILDIYENSDVYEILGKEITKGKLNRKEFKGIIVPYLNGCGVHTIAKKTQIDEVTVRQWLIELKKVIAPVDYYLDGETYRASRKGEVCSQDWRMSISPDTNFLTLRNWSIQACGADIMRRACFNLDRANIPVLLTNHDSFLVQLEEDNSAKQLEQALKALSDASAEILDGFRLTAKVELTLPSKNEI
jgi:hypothetical protein